MKQRDVDRAVIMRQREALIEANEKIQALEVELEATRALANAEPHLRETFLLERARWYRDLAHYYKDQAELAFALIRKGQKT